MHEAERGESSITGVAGPSAIRAAVTWISAPAATSASHPLPEVAAGMPLRVRDETAEATPGERTHRQLEVIAERARTRLDEDRAPSPERYPPAVVVVELVEHRLGDLAAGHDPHLDLLPCQLGVDLCHPFLQLADHHGVARMDVRRRRNHLDAVRNCLARHADTVVEVAGPVVEARQDVAVKVDHSGPVFPGPCWNSRVRRILILAVAGIALVACGDDQPQSTAERVVQVGGRPSAQTSRGTTGARQRGLSGRESLDEEEGMLFLLANDSPSIWMKGMRFAIDIVWIQDGRVVDVTADVPPPRGSNAPLPTYSPDRPANRALEVSAGWAANHGIRRGDLVRVRRGGEGGAGRGRRERTR